MRSRVTGRLRTAQIAIVAIAAMGALAAASGCSTLPPQEREPVDGPAESAGVFDPDTLGWDPSALRAHLPGVVGWRQTGASGPGELVALSSESSAAVVWEAPAGVDCRPIGLDPARGVLACVVGALDGRAFPEAAYLCAADGSVATVAVPEGYDTLTAFEFMADGAGIALATRYASDSIESTIGLVAADGQWKPVALGGTLPEFQFVENVFAIPATDKIAVVLKTQGTPANRDDEALVIAGYSDGTLSSFTPAFREDSLPNAAPFWGQTGVVFVRTWRTGASGGVAADLVSAVFADGQWNESVLVEDGAITTGIESGTIAVARPDGSLFVRSSGVPGTAQGAELLSVGASGKLTRAGIDVADVTGLRWYTE
ncbi:MAG: hypothetical protein ACYC77_00670 [Coriobacteriia bacterium]